MSSLRETILGSTELPTKPVQAPELPKVGTLHIRTLRGTELSVGQAICAMGDQKDKQSEMVGKFLALVLCDEGGNRVFADEDWKALLNLPLAPLRRCFEQGIHFCGLTDGAVEGLVKNSEATSSADSGSA